MKLSFRWDLRLQQILVKNLKGKSLCFFYILPQKMDKKESSAKEM